jgi:L-ascorbate metabolism protein UlaG (beta-lactamase superfamily)
VGLVDLRFVGAATALIELGGLHLLTDPSFDPAGTEHDRGSYSLVKTTDPGMPADDLGAIDAVLLSHDHHPDNLDASGRRILARVGRVITTGAGADRLGEGAIGLAPGDSVGLARPGGGDLTVTAVHAQHGPDGTDHLTGPVIGFVLAGDELPRVYVSGDNASVDVVREIARAHGPIEIAVLFAGAARAARIDGPLTLTGERAAEAAQVLDARAVIPLHWEGWAHFSEGIDEVRDAFAAAGLTDRLVVCEPGATVSV